MMKVLKSALPLVLLLAACSQQSTNQASYEAGAPAEEAARAASDAAAPVEMKSVDGPAEPASAGSAAQPASTPASIPVSIPKIAYVYEFGYRVAADTIPELQRKHADLCEKQGPQVCRIIDMRQSGGEDDYASGSLALAVAAPRARAFGGELSKLAGEAGGEEISSAISGEDLSKQIVDTQARLRARTVLRDRLMEVLASRKGSVAELVEAERGVAQVNEEIDQAQSWLAEMQGRVDFSQVNISYESGIRSGGGFLSPIRGAIGSIGTILGTVFATIIVLLTIFIPLGLFGWGSWKLFRRIRPKRQPVGQAGDSEG